MSILTEVDINGALNQIVRRECQENPSVDRWALADDILSSLGPESVRHLAKAHLAIMVDTWRREQVRNIERQSCRLEWSRVEQRDVYIERTAGPTREERASMSEEDVRKIWRQRAEEDDRIEAELKGFPQYRDDPLRDGVGPRNITERKEFRRWMGDAFDPWYEQMSETLQERCDGSPDDWRRFEWFEAEWDPRGPQIYWADKLGRSVQKEILRIGSQMRLELSQELLDAEIALGDGTRTTWGEATVEQHQQRLEMLTANANANAAAAARHVAAIHMLESSGCHNLSEFSPVDRLMRGVREREAEELLRAG